MLQIDEEAIAWTCNGLQKICLTISDTEKKKNSDIKIYERPKIIL